MSGQVDKKMVEECGKRRAPSAKVVVFVLVVVALLVMDGWFGWSQNLFAEDAIGSLRNLVASHPVAAGALYVALSVVGCVALAVPGVVFAVVAGTVFGPWWGTFLCWLAMSLGAMGSFLIARYFLKDSLKPRLVRYELLDRVLFREAGKSDVFLLALTRLVPLFPFNVQNFAYGVTDVSFWRYSLYSALFILPGTAAYAMGAAGLVAGGDGVVYVVLAVVLLGVSLGVAALLKKKEGLS